MPIGRDRIEDSVALGIVPEQISRPCGRCGQSAWLRRRQAIQAGWRWLYQDTYCPVVWAMYECSGCNDVSLGIFQAYYSTGRWRFHEGSEFIPTARARAIGIPHEDIEADRLEAWACHYAGQHRAALLMARSALQRAVRVLDAKFRGSFNAELDSLVDTGVITRQLRKNADEVRLSGNDVAHPEKLEMVTAKDAEDSLQFLDDFIETTITIPERQRRREEARQAQVDEQAP